MTDPVRVTRRMLLCGAVGAVSFVLVFLVVGATRTGYSPMRHTVSAASNGPGGWVQIFNFVVTGSLMVVFALGVRRALSPGRVSAWASSLLGVFGVALVLSGVFTTDPMLGYPPGTPVGTPTETTWQHTLHDLAGVLVFVSLPAAALVVAGHLRSIRSERRWALYSAATGSAMVVLLVLFVVAGEQESAVTGLIQRIMIVVGWAWVALIALHLARRGTDTDR